LREEQVSFFSAGERVSGLLRLPDDPRLAPYPAIVQGPGWLQLKEAKRNPPYHRAFTGAGFAVLVIDFRGFGQSEGDPTDLLPSRWLEDLTNAVSYLAMRADVDEHAIGTFGSGGTGGGNAVMLAAADPRIRCAVSQSPIADGADWLRRMRRGYEWYELLERLEEDRRRRVSTGRGSMVHPRKDIMVPTPEREARDARSGTQDTHIREVSLRSVDALLAYRPIDVVGRVRRLMVVGVENDPVTPTDHAEALYDGALEPKRLVMQRRTTHYAAYERYAPHVIPLMVEWFASHLQAGPIEIREQTYPASESFRTIGGARTDSGQEGE
jgi:dipeptidyl aminopeptidase/acylaminoacyl peptidase